MQVKKETISILGCGWLGFPLAINLIKQGFSVNGSVRSGEKKSLLQSNNITPYLIDIDKENTINVNFLSADVLVIAIPSKNINGFQKLISQIEKSSIKRVVLISSTSVYPNSVQPILESHKTLDTPLASIETLFFTNQNFKTIILRFGGLFGAGRNPGNFFSNGRIIKNPDGVVNMIHQEDCIAIILKIIEKKSGSEVFNACSDTHPTRREFYTKAKLNLGNEAPVFEENQSIQMKKISSEKIKEALGFTFKYSNLLNI